ncbi:MAG TPA: TonB-dependent receptor [Polyangia bacterium]|jgi:hypothetical protein|nr:TonB-dependent receptor [Polyangia bacterium]
MLSRRHDHHRERPAGLARVLLCVLLLPSTFAWAGTRGNIAGLVTDLATGKPLAGVTVTATSPALQGEQTEFTDSGGHYLITELPPGEYTIRFYYANLRVERPGVILYVDQTLQVNAGLPSQRASTQTYRILEKAPSVDVAHTQIQTQITSDLTRLSPFGRNLDSVLSLAPGAARDPIGVSFGGATGAENNFLIDGINATGLSTGLQSSNFSLEFIQQTEIITGGFNAEYGRSTGGVVNAITKAGSNQFHGGTWFFYSPFSLQSAYIGRTSESLLARRRQLSAFDFGFDLGGPIVKDRVWFYAGFHPQFQTDLLERIVRVRTADNVDRDPGRPQDPYLGDTVATPPCPPWIRSTNPALCPPGDGGDTTSSSYVLRDLPQYTRSTRLQRHNYQYIGKLNIQLTPDHQIVLQYLGTNTSNEQAGPTSGDTFGLLRTTLALTHDAKAQLLSKFLDRRLQLDLSFGFHGDHSDPSRLVNPTGNQSAVIDARTTSLAAYDDIPECAIRAVGQSGRTFNPCPVTNYRYGGIGANALIDQQRFTVALGLSYYFRAAGPHGLKFGFDVEDNRLRNYRFFTGQGNYTIQASGRVRYQQYATRGPDGRPVLLPQGFDATTTTTNESFYLRDSWNVGPIRGLTINAGIRWDLQQIHDIYGKTQISLIDNLTPRVGLVYDFSRKGHSKLFASYGRIYESVPLDINDRQFSNEGIVLQTEPRAGRYCPRVSVGQALDVSQCNFPDPTFLNGGTFGVVSPVLRGQYVNNFDAGVQYDVGWDTIVSASYQYRSIGRIVEDLSPDGGNNYIIANPGDTADPRVVRRLQDEIRNIEAQIAQTADPQVQQELRLRHDNRVATLARYQATSGFPAPTRNYHALILTVNKRLARNFTVLASYTFSRTYGNYPGTYNYFTGQLDPNISSDYDLRDLLGNRRGPLPNDRPHNIKVTGAYTIPFRSSGLTLGLNFSAYSGVPIQVLGAHPIYGTSESYILPSGSGGRTPFVTNFDLRVAYVRQFSGGVRLDLTAEIFNLFNQRAPITVDNNYTFDLISPIAHGRISDLRQLTNANTGAPIRINTNYGQPTAYQPPLSLRLGIRLSF